MQNKNLQKAIEYLSTTNGSRIYKPMDFKELLEQLHDNPEKILRNVFQLFHDMIKSYVGEGIDEYTGDPQSIHYKHYDCSKLFVEGSDHPFFADRLFANRLMNLVDSLKRSAQQNKIYIFKGPPGSGKSTFLNNLLRKFEEYTRTEEGMILKTIWRLDPSKLGVDISRIEIDIQEDYVEVPCPSFDHPILMIPKQYRKDFFQEMFSDSEFKERLFTDKEFDWVWRDEPCTICSSLYKALLERLHDPWKVFQMIYAQPHHFNRRLGEGISVYTPGDKPLNESYFTNPELQKKIDTLLKDSNRVKYIFSQFAKTNNGIYALMDIKSNNETRFMDLHNIVSEGSHKVEEIEETVHSLFLAVMNPEDQKIIKDFNSFEDRIEYIKIPYVLDIYTEVEIYKNTFGQHIENKFLPMVLNNFARVIISTRLNRESPALLEWINFPRKYRDYCDENLHLLKMEIFRGNIPYWITEEDKKKFTAERRRKIIQEAETEGEKGISGRESIKIFNDFFSKYAKEGKLITMDTLCNFFNNAPSEIADLIPEHFLDSLVNLYNHSVLQEVKEAMYYYNQERISRDIQNYLFAVNFEPGSTQTCTFTKEQLEITTEFFENIENKLLHPQEDKNTKRRFREDTQKKYSSVTLPQEIMQEKKDIRDTQIYQDLFQRYVYNLKEKVLEPFLDNENFRRAIKSFHEEEFKSYDKRIQEDVRFLIKNLCNKFGYSEEGAKEICIYVIDNDLTQKFDLERILA